MPLAGYRLSAVTLFGPVQGFGETYADQNERDYAALQAAVKDGRNCCAWSAPGTPTPRSPAGWACRKEPCASTWKHL